MADERNSGSRMIGKLLLAALIVSALAAAAVLSRSSNDCRDHTDIVQTKSFAEVRKYAAAGKYWLPETDEWADNGFHAVVSFSDETHEALTQITMESRLTGERTLKYTASAQPPHGIGKEREILNAQCGGREVSYVLMGGQSCSEAVAFFVEDGVYYTLDLVCAGRTSREDEETAAWLLTLCGAEK